MASGAAEPRDLKESTKRSVEGDTPSSRKEGLMQHARHQRLHRAFVYALLASVLGVVTLVLSQCTMVGDSVTGIGLEKNQRSNCIQNCKSVRDECRAQAQHECNGDPACLDAAFLLCQQAFQECKNSCHKQGAGNAG